MNELEKKMREALNSKELTSFKVTDAMIVGRSSQRFDSGSNPVLEAEYSATNKASPMKLQLKEVKQALQCSPVNTLIVPGPLDMMQQQTRALNAYNSNHSAKQTRARQVKEEQFQELLWRSSHELSASLIRPLVNRPSVTGQFPFEILPEKLADEVRRISNATGWAVFNPGNGPGCFVHRLVGQVHCTIG